jgi:hypothetical protein
LKSDEVAQVSNLLLCWNRKLKSFLFAFYKAGVSERPNETHLVKVKQEGEEVEKSEPLLAHDLFFEVGL